MKNKRQIYLVYSCDDWKSTDSMRLEMATTSVRRLKSFIAKKIKAGDYYYGSEEESRQVERFKRDFDTETRDYINSLLIYGFYDCTYDGEEI